MKVCLLFAVAVLLFSCSPKLAPDNNWAIGRWVLTELKEVPVQITGNPSKNAHLIFEPAGKKYRGFGGCNDINGTYIISSGKIKFVAQSGKLAGCPDVPFETTFLSALNDVDKYSVTGNVMILKKGRTTLIKLERK
ncbi:META domain-containing protein [Ferruginibacter paludis]|uniref:META domain-containing protein n=1 Tax=Ferruginibacter paludis TaxID=1310417 RepID=UPI0025B36D3C|nr:META domain-containing protein [Ferruginibacter paludis]MDN3657177.1 META domain-containing protein [Ferruginibacter paludis]